MLNALDRHGVQCDFCHRAVDHNYVAGVSPIQDFDVLDEIDPLPLQYGNGQFINDPAPLMRGPYGDAEASHAFVESPFHTLGGDVRHLPRRLESGLHADGRLRLRADAVRRGASRHGHPEHDAGRADLQRVVAERVRVDRRLRAAVRREQARRHRLDLPGLPHARRDGRGVQRARRPEPQRPRAARLHGRQHVRSRHHRELLPGRGRRGPARRGEGAGRRR